MSAIRLFLAGALAAAALAPAAQAARHDPHRAANAHKPPPGVETLGSAGAWTAYASHDPSGRVCYLAGEPEKSEPSGFARKEPMAMVTHRPAENIANVVSFVEGYPLKPDSNVVLDVDGRKFELFTKDDAAWARTSDLDRTIVGALAKARTAVARGEPQRGRPTADVYSLAGFAKALALIDQACGVKRDEAGAAPRAAARSAHHPVHHRIAKHRRAKHPEAKRPEALH